MLYNISRIKGKTLLSLVTTIIVITALLIPYVRSAIETEASLRITGTIEYTPSIEISVNQNIVLKENAYSLGFQLDGRDINQWTNSITLQNMAQEADFSLVRFFEHRLGKPCTYWDESTKTGTWDWRKIDTLIRQIYSIGAEPLIVLGFYSWTQELISSAPTGMQTDPNTRLPDPDQWGAYCAEWVEHFKQEGLPVKYYEIINEPFHYFGWEGEQPRLGYFMELYNSASIAMKNENPNILLGSDGCKTRNVLDYFISNGEDLGFISFHRYGVTTLSASDSEIINAAETKYIEDSRTIYGIDTARELYYQERGLDLPVIMSEGNANSAYDGGTDPRTRQMIGASYTALSIRTFILNDVKHSIYFNFGSRDTEGIGMVNIDNNEPWYPYYAQKMISNNLAVGDEIIQSTSASPDLRTLAWINQGKINILIISKTQESQTFRIEGLDGPLTVNLIDESISWLNPTIQTSVIDSSQRISTNGYAVALIQSPM